MLSTFAVQKTHIHFGRQRGGIKLFNHFYRCAGISRQGQQVDIAAVNQTEGNGAVAQAVKRAVVAMRPLFKVQVFQYPVEAPTHNIQNQPTVFDFRKKHIVVRSGVTLCFLVFQDMFEKWNGGCQTDSGRFMAFHLGHGQAQVVVVAVDDFNVLVLQLPNIARSHEGVNHEAYEPIDFHRHLVVGAAHPRPFAFAPVGEGLALQFFGFAQNGFVLGDGKAAA